MINVAVCLYVFLVAEMGDLLALERGYCIRLGVVIQDGCKTVGH